MRRARSPAGPATLIVLAAVGIHACGGSSGGSEALRDAGTDGLVDATTDEPVAAACLACEPETYGCTSTVNHEAATAEIVDRSSSGCTLSIQRGPRFELRCGHDLACLGGGCVSVDLHSTQLELPTESSTITCGAWVIDL